VSAIAFESVEKLLVRPPASGASKRKAIHRSPRASQEHIAPGCRQPARGPLLAPACRHRALIQVKENAMARAWDDEGSTTET